MSWFVPALACALLTALCDALSKHLMKKNDEWFTGAVILGSASLLLLPVFLSLDLRPFSIELALLLAVALPLEIFAYYLFLSAIRMAPLSMTVPLLAFTTVFSILTSWILLGETITASGAAGICLVTFGAYVLNGDLVHQSFWAPIKATLSNPGSRRMLYVALIWSITSALGKKGVILYDAIPFGFVLLVGDFVFFAGAGAYLHFKGRMQIRMGLADLLLFVIGGALMAAIEITHFVALSKAPVAYMISVKRLSLVFGVILGWAVFGEANIRHRLIAASIMVLGVFFIYNHS